MQQQVFGTQRCYYNNNQPYPTTANSNDNGSISFGINIDGKVSFGGSSKLSLTSWVHEIFMWGGKLINTPYRKTFYVLFS